MIATALRPLISCASLDTISSARHCGTRSFRQCRATPRWDQRTAEHPAQYRRRMRACRLSTPTMMTTACSPGDRTSSQLAASAGLMTATAEAKRSFPPASPDKQDQGAHRPCRRRDRPVHWWNKSVSRLSNGSPLKSLATACQGQRCSAPGERLAEQHRTLASLAAKSMSDVDVITSASLALLAR